MTSINLIENLVTSSTIGSTLLNMVGVVLTACVTILAFLGVFLSVEQSKDEGHLKTILLQLITSSGNEMTRRDTQEVQQNARLLRLHYWKYFRHFNVLRQTFEKGIRKNAILIGKSATVFSQTLIIIGWGFLENEIETSINVDILHLWVYRFFAFAILIILLVLLCEVKRLLIKIEHENVITNYPSPEELLDIRRQGKIIDTIDFMTNSVLCYVRLDNRYFLPDGKPVDGLLVRVALPLPFHNAKIEIEVYIEDLDETFKSPRTELRYNPKVSDAASPNDIPEEQYLFFFEISKYISKGSRLRVNINVYPNDSPKDHRFHLICYPYDLSEENALDELTKGQYFNLYRMSWVSEQELTEWQKSQDEVVIISTEHKD